MLDLGRIDPDVALHKYLPAVSLHQQLAINNRALPLNTRQLDPRDRLASTCAALNICDFGTREPRITEARQELPWKC
jgi:hypothetical protein